MSSTAPAPEKYAPYSLSATLVKSQPLTAEVRLLTLEIENASRLEYLPGQSIRVEQELNGKLVPLAYSIASPPGSGNCIELCIKPGRKGSPADRLCALQVGAQLRVSPPQGGFTLQPAEAASLFLAAGTGIAPIRSMIHWLFRQNAGQSVTLIFGAKDADSLFFHDEFLDLAGRHANFHYVPVLSRPQEGWSGARGYVQNHLSGISSQAARAYLCGPPAMVQSASRSLAELGWPEHLIHFERNGG
jgi:phenol hydroxylase P5 protein